jgi:glycosyltransferase involved in cell wall biosynthesis
MQGVQKIIPVFYARGVNAPYTEGHIQVVRMMAKSLSLQNVKSMIFNFKYGVNQLITEDSDISSQRIDQCIPLIRRDSMYKFNPPISAYALSMETLKTLKFFLIENSLRGNKCVVNIVNCSRYPRMLLAGLSKVPIILHFYMLNIRLKTMTRALTDKADLIIVSSKAISHSLEEIGVSKEKMRIVYPPIDTELYRPLRRHPSATQRIVYIGSLKRNRFPEDKVLEVIKELVKDMPKATLSVFTSRGRENLMRIPEIRKKAEKANLTSRIKIWAKDLTDHEKTAIYNAADVFLFPSFETYRTAIEPPLTVLEAMSSGLAVVAPKGLSLSELIRDNENGFLCETADSSSLVQKLSRVLFETRSRIAASKEARNTICNRASLRVVGAKMVAIYKNLLGDEESEEEYDPWKQRHRLS